MIETKDFDLIDKYLRYELTQKDLLAMEERKKSKDFAELLSEMETISGSLSEVGAQQLRTEMEQWYEEEDPVKKPRTKILVWISIAASVLILCGLIVWNSKKPERLSHSFATHFPDYISQVKRGQESEDLTYARLMLPYHSRNWEDALAGFDNYLSQHPDDFKIELYLGVALFQDKDYANAIASLQEVLGATDNTTFTEPARWYLILAYIADDQEEKAIQLLAELIENQQHFEYDKATQLLNILAN